MNILNTIGSFFKRFRSGTSIDPVQDWLMFLSLATVCLVGIIVWNVWAFDTVSSGGTIGAPRTETPTVFNVSSLQEIHSIFANRAAEETKYITGVYMFTDPSL